MILTPQPRSFEDARHRISDRRLCSTLFSRVAQDPQVFEALPLDEMRDAADLPAQGSVLGWVSARRSRADSECLRPLRILIYTLNQRTREIGIRMALGATASGVVGLVVRQSARLAALGAAVGMVAAFGLLRTAVLSSSFRRFRS